MPIRDFARKRMGRAKGQLAPAGAAACRRFSVDPQRMRRESTGLIAYVPALNPSAQSGNKHSGPNRLVVAYLAWRTHVSVEMHTIQYECRQL